MTEQQAGQSELNGLSSLSRYAIEPAGTCYVLLILDP